LAHKLNENNRLNVTTYVCARENETIIATSDNGSHAKNSSISREFDGADVRWGNTGKVFDKGYTISFSLNHNKSTDARTDTNVLTNFVPTNIANRNVEIGTKAFIEDDIQFNLNLFRITIENELVVKNSAFGRSVYTNANDTKGIGAELSIESQFDHNISTYFSYTLLNAKFDTALTGNSGLIESENCIPGTYKTRLYGEVARKYTPWALTLLLKVTTKVKCMLITSILMQLRLILTSTYVLALNKTQPVGTSKKLSELKIYLIKNILALFDLTIVTSDSLNQLWIEPICQA
jgi:hypothetical protein